MSVPSVTDNDENVLVIRGDKRVADIYFGEFIVYSPTIDSVTR